MISEQLKKKRIQFLDENLLAPNSSSGLSESLPVGSSHEIISVVFSSPQHRQTVSDSSSLEQSESERSLRQYRQPAFLVANFNHFLKCVIRNPLKHWQHWVASCYSILCCFSNLGFWLHIEAFMQVDEQEYTHRVWGKVYVISGSLDMEVKSSPSGHNCKNYRVVFVWRML